VAAAGHILVIEDDAGVREALSKVLGDAGLRVEVATDGLTGLERLRKGARPSVIVLDLQMPRLCGVEFLHEMRADPRFEHIPVITMSGGGADPARDEDRRADVQRPFDPEDLLGIVLSLTEPSAA
jgi:CheY-like chemotaxis protein